MTKCDVIQDLLPLYIDDVASKSSCAMVDEHIKNCLNCRSTLSKMQTGDSVHLSIDEAEIGAFKNMKRKIFRNSVIIATLSALVVLATVIGISISLVGIPDNVNLIIAIVVPLLVVNVFFGLYNLRVTNRIKTLTQMQTIIFLLINILNTGNCIIHLLINIIIGAYKKS